MLLKQFHKPSPSHHHFYRWYVYHSQSWVVYEIALPTLSRRSGSAPPVDGFYGGMEAEKRLELRLCQKLLRPICGRETSPENPVFDVKQSWVSPEFSLRPSHNLTFQTNRAKQLEARLSSPKPSKKTRTPLAHMGYCLSNPYGCV